MRPLLFDQGVWFRVAGMLREDGWDVVHTEDLGMARASDEEVLARASDDGRVVVTMDSDFAMLLALSGAVGPSVIHIRTPNLSRTTFKALIQSVVEEVDDRLEQGCVVSVSKERLRIRPLPI